MAETGLTRWRDRWTAAGFPAIPLRPGGKVPTCAAWQSRPPGEQWAEVGGVAFRGNVGVVTGGPLGAAVVDCDDARAVANVKAALRAMGLDPERLPQVQTATPDHLHLWLRLRNAPAGAFQQISPTVGAGELRYGPNAYVVAPCSWVGGNRYQFAQGGPEAIPTLKPIEWRDLFWLVTPTIRPSPATLGLTTPPLRLVWRPMPDRVAYLLTVMATASKGRSVAGYPSRSEAEAAAVAGLILAGWDFDAIFQAFRRYRPGHFTEHSKPEGYLLRTYRNILNGLACSPIRADVATTYHAAEVSPWPGRGGPMERAVYLALLAICWVCDGWQVRASERCLAEHAAGDRKAVHAALGRLQESSLVYPMAAWAWDGMERTGKAATWLVGKEMSLSSPEDTCLRGSDGDRGVAELWAGGALGRSAGQVYAVLGGEPVRAVDLAGRTGRQRETVAGALWVLEGHGLAQRVAGGWVKGDRALGEVIEALGCDKRAVRRWEEHDLERQAWREMMATMDSYRREVEGCEVPAGNSVREA